MQSRGEGVVRMRIFFRFTPPKEFEFRDLPVINIYTYTYIYIYIFQQSLEQSKQTRKLSQLQNEKFEFTYNYFPCHLLTETR